MLIAKDLCALVEMLEPSLFNTHNEIESYSGYLTDVEVESVKELPDGNFLVEFHDYFLGSFRVNIPVRVHKHQVYWLRFGRKRVNGVMRAHIREIRV